MAASLRKMPENTPLNFAETVLPTVGGAEGAQAQFAFHFGTMYVLQIVEQVVALKLAEKQRSHWACWNSMNS